MKKSINITLNGQIFNIEEDAYEKLESYLDSIKAYYEEPEEEKEILADIESSIAEKLSERLKAGRQAVTREDVEAIIKIMGTVKEIVENDEDGENPDWRKAADKEKNDKEGAAFRKRLYRNPDDVVIAGVASGIAAYFGIDPVFVRLLFLLLTLANGIGLLAYIIFWMAMPQALTNAQKLEMRGKPVNLAEIEQAVKEKSRQISQEGEKVFKRFRSGNVWHQILNFPIRVVEAIFQLIRKIFAVMFPVLSVIIGLFIMIFAVCFLVGISVAAAMMAFNISSPYIISDLPLMELAANPLYYVGLAAFFLAFAIPNIFAVCLAITMIRRKNSFNLVASLILLAVWIFSLAAGAVATADLVPMIRTKAAEASQRAITTRLYDYKDFNKLYISGNQHLEVVKGDVFSIELSGRQSDLDYLDFRIENGQLQIMERERANKGICVFCGRREISGKIIMPNLDSFVGVRSSRAELKGFDKDLYVSLGESARAEIELKGQSLSGTLSGIASRLQLSGPAKDVDLKMDGSADLSSTELLAEKIKLNMSVYSFADLSGQVKKLEVEMKGGSRLEAYDLIAGDVSIRAIDSSRAEVFAQDSLAANVTDEAAVYYKGEPKKVTANAEGEGVIQKYGQEETGASIKIDRIAPNLAITTDIEKYSPTMSSVRGIGLLPDYTEPGVTFRWRTSQGALVTDWDNAVYSQVVDTSKPGQKVYWTFSPGKMVIKEDEPIYVYLEAIQLENSEVVDSTKIEFRFDDQGAVIKR